MISVVVSVGSNCGDRLQSVTRAIDWLKTVLIQVKVSDIYETPCATGGSAPYMNAVLQGFYQGTGIDFEDLLKEKEREFGRTDKCREKGEVPVDIDLVICDGTVYKEWDFRQKFFKIGYSQL